jgi:transmembrane sensor
MDPRERNASNFEKAELILKFLHGGLSPEEDDRLKLWLAQNERNLAFLESLTNDASLEECLDFLSAVDVPTALEKTLARMKGGHAPVALIEGGLLRWLTRWKGVAAILFVSLTGLAFLWGYIRQQRPEPATAVFTHQDVLPGGWKATLRLADGSVIALKDTGTSVLRTGNGIRITQQNGEVIYENTGEGNTAMQGHWNTISTPLGGKYKLLLPDGSRVWLNAGSDLRFPAAFEGSRRDVELTGEAYFEVADNEHKPFRVKVNGLTVDVLGTHFNVKAYGDEPLVQATLIEGSVKVSTHAGEELLRPGKQANLHKANEHLEIREANIKDVLAWKNDLFRFSKESLEEVMRKIGRWYNVEVVYSGVETDTQFSGMISRNVPLSQVLKMLEMTGGARFRVEGRRVTVLP